MQITAKYSSAISHASLSRLRLWHEAGLDAGNFCLAKSRQIIYAYAYAYAGQRVVIASYPNSHRALICNGKMSRPRDKAVFALLLM